MRPITKEEAYKLHIEMWTAMREKYGDNPSLEEREHFKEYWCWNNVYNNCFLCEYAQQRSGLMSYSPTAYRDMCGKYCPVVWGESTERACCCEASRNVNWNDSNINDILALPERERSEWDEGVRVD